MTGQQIIEALNWRYATKKFDSEKKVSEADLKILFQVANLTATSLGIQPFKIKVVANDFEKLKSATFNQENIQTCSHLIILCLRNDVNDEYISNYVRYMENVRGLEKNALAKYEASCQSFVSTLDDNRKNAWLAHQTYIILGNLLAACALLKIDSCPMEGFNAKLVDEILGLEDQNLKSVLMLPIGYRAADDRFAEMKKVRRPMEVMIEIV